MKQVSPNLLLIMSRSQFMIQELYTFTLADGTVMRLADYDTRATTLVANGVEWPATGLLFKRSLGKQAVGLEVGSMDVTIYADPLDTTTWINGLTFQQFVRGGGLDGATLLIERVFMEEWGDCEQNGTLRWFFGRIADVQAGRTTITLSVNSLPDLLSVPMPRDVYQPGCLNVLYEPNTCRLIKANFAHGLMVDPASTQTIISAPVDRPDGYFTLGTLEFTSGENTGIIRTIKQHSAGAFPASSTFTLTLPLPVAPISGDTFTAYPGCDLAMATCINKFANLVNYRGQPFIPAAETATP